MIGRCVAGVWESLSADVTSPLWLHCPALAGHLIKAPGVYVTHRAFNFNALGARILN